MKINKYLKDDYKNLNILDPYLLLRSTETTDILIFLGSIKLLKIKYTLPNI